MGQPTAQTWHPSSLRGLEIKPPGPSSYLLLSQHSSVSSLGLTTLLGMTGFAIRYCSDKTCCRLSALFSSAAVVTALVVVQGSFVSVGRLQL